MYGLEQAHTEGQGGIIEPIFPSTSQAYRDSDEMEAALAELKDWAMVEGRSAIQRALEFEEESRTLIQLLAVELAFREVGLAPRSSWAGRTLRQIDFRGRFGGVGEGLAGRSGSFAGVGSAAQRPTAGGRTKVRGLHFIVPSTSNACAGFDGEKRPPGGRSGAARPQGRAGYLFCLPARS